jgi:hypothetical protein
MSTKKEIIIYGLAEEIIKNTNNSEKIKSLAKEIKDVLENME